MAFTSRARPTSTLLEIQSELERAMRISRIMTMAVDGCDESLTVVLGLGLRMLDIADSSAVASRFIEALADIYAPPQPSRQEKSK